MDRLTGLTAFVRVVDNGGFSAAARKLNMSTTWEQPYPGAGRTARRAPAQSHDAEGQRQRGRPRLSRAASKSWPISNSPTTSGALQSTPRGTLRIYAHNHMVRFLAPIVNSFLLSYPDIKVEVTMGERTIDMIDEGFDIAIRMGRRPIRA